MSSGDSHKRLDRFKNLIVTEKSKPPTPPLPSRYRRLADAMGGELVSRDEGLFCLVKTVYPFGERFGNVTLPESDLETNYPLSAFSADQQSGFVSQKSLLFFDIETTGLGGTGAVPFLIGCGSITPDGFEVRQYLLPDYTDETAMLEAILTELSGDQVIVSYNGAAFDMTMIRDRMIINRVARNIEPAGHLDLLHPTRRLFRRRLQDCTLVNIERQLFGYHRVDDIPGFLIPSVYFAWLSDENLDQMSNVLLHNRLDIFALYFLLVRIAEVFQSNGESLIDVDDLHSLSRVFERRKMPDKALEVCNLMDCQESVPVANDILLFQSMTLKRVGRLEEAVSVWERLSGANSREGYFANVELAKYYEHREKDIRKALEAACRAQKGCPGGTTHRKALDHRLVRLRAKMASSSL